MVLESFHWPGMTVTPNRPTCGGKPGHLRLRSSPLRPFVSRKGGQCEPNGFDVGLTEQWVPTSLSQKWQRAVQCVVTTLALGSVDGQGQVLCQAQHSTRTSTRSKGSSSLDWEGSGVPDQVRFTCGGWHWHVWTGSPRCCSPASAPWQSGQTSTCSCGVQYQSLSSLCQMAEPFLQELLAFQMLGYWPETLVDNGNSFHLMW